ncbi:hypothetical protein EFL96_12250 [Lactococcus lactis]|uniref:hypothetical protein n=1 Tax=Lactococcus lactis TaxID=1358 RepID=UPI00223A7914|nr:hypothetical protein [Lactococcus lactis]MCT1186653.1 hypothetical protein [Lactococcus lactis]MCT1190662.1 hypothetical protein [Lactococcus lactis]
MDIVFSILLALIFVGLTTVGYFLKDLPTLLRELRVEESRKNSEKEIQREIFFRQLKGSELANTLEDWSDLIMNLDKTSKTATDGDRLSALQKRVLLYGSDRSVKILSETMQNFYHSSENSFIAICFICHLICSLKYDFTGYEILPIDIIKIKIKDYDSKENKEKFTEAQDIVEGRLKELGLI